MSIRAANGSATPVTVDGTKEAEVIALWDKAMADDADGAPDRSRASSTWATTPPSTSAR